MLISILDGCRINLCLICSLIQNVLVVFSPQELYMKIKVNDMRIKYPQDGEINLDFWQDLRGFVQNKVM